MWSLEILESQQDLHAPVYDKVEEPVQLQEEVKYQVEGVLSRRLKSCIDSQRNAATFRKRLIR